MLLGRKLGAAVNNYEPRTNASFDLVTKVSPLLALDPIRFGPILLLAVYGPMLQSRARHLRAHLLFGAIVSVPLLTCIGFFVSGEYRHPALPALAYFAAVAVERIWRAAKSPKRECLFSPPFGLWIVPAMAIAIFAPTHGSGHAQDRKAYAEALAMPGSDQTRPTRESYALARRLLAQHDESVEDSVLATEALLLVESNEAIQFKDKSSGERLISTARRLWKTDLVPGRQLGVSVVERIRRNLVRRVARLCSQPFVEDWTDLHEALTLLGCGNWQEARFLLEQGQLAECQQFLDKALEYAPASVEVMAYKGLFAWRQHTDGTPWLEASLNGYPRIALPAVFLGHGALARGDVASAKRYAEEALRREPGNREAQQLAVQCSKFGGG